MNRRERRRAQSLKESIATGEHNREGSPEFEKEVRDSELALELEQHVRKTALLPWLAKHPRADFTVTAPALLRLAAMQIMAAMPGSTPEDVGTFAAEVAKTVVSAAAEVSQKAREYLENEMPAADRAETIVEKQVRLVLEKQTRELVDKMKPWVPAGVGFILFLADYGVKGNVAYVSTIEREDALKTVAQWLSRQVR